MRRVVGGAGLFGDQQPARRVAALVHPRRACSAAQCWASVLTLRRPPTGRRAAQRAQTADHTAPPPEIWAPGYTLHPDRCLIDSARPACAPASRTERAMWAVSPRIAATRLDSPSFSVRSTRSSAPVGAPHYGHGAAGWGCGLSSMPPSIASDDVRELAHPSPDQTGGSLLGRPGPIPGRTPCCGPGPVSR